MSSSDLGFIHRFIPSRSGQPAPTLLLLHSTGGDENQLLQLGSTLAPDAALLSPRGKVLEGSMPRFFRRLAEGVFDLEDLKARTHELASFVEAASTTYHFDPAGVVAVGYSNGANIAASALLLRPELLAAAVLFHPMVPLEPESTPTLTGRPVFIGAGQFDPMVARAETERLAALLEDAGADVTLHWRPGGHMLIPEEITAAQAWLSQRQIPATASRR